MTEDRVVYSPGICTKCSLTVDGAKPALKYMGQDSEGRDVFKCPNPECSATYYVKGDTVVTVDSGT